MTDELETRDLADILAAGDDRGGDSAAQATAAEPAALRPRTRWAGVVWGLAFAALAGAGLWLASGEGRVDDVVGWIRSLTVASAIGYGALALGGILLVTGLVGLLRRAQRAAAARSK